MCSLFAMLNTMTKCNSGRKESFCLTPPGNSPSLREDKYELRKKLKKARTESEAFKNAIYWLVSLL